MICQKTMIDYGTCLSVCLYMCLLSLSIHVFSSESLLAEREEQMNKSAKLIPDNRY